MELFTDKVAVVGLQSIKEMEQKLAGIAANLPAARNRDLVDGKLRVMICGTYYTQYNGYSRVVYELLRRLQHKKDLELTLYGFQNVKDIQTHRVPLDDCVTLVDAALLENPKRNGFGEVEIVDYLNKNPQDIVIIYNDMSVTNVIMQNILKGVPMDKRKSMKFVSYIDQVYLHQKFHYIKLLNDHFDHIIAFTPYWRDVLRGQDIRESMRIDVLPHGFNHDTYYVVPRKVARSYFHLPQDAFLVLNLNRNQPRKRWDVCLIAYAEVCRMHYEAQKASPQKKMRPMKLVIATLAGSCWDFFEILAREFKKKKIPENLLGTYVEILTRPQQMTDQEVNLLYNACDVGINTCDGEGFGLCNFEQAALGNPQIVPLLGGFRDFFHDKNALMVQPKYHLYVDQIRDGIGGETEVCDAMDFAQAIWKYYNNPQMVQKHGAQARKEIIPNYRWDDIAEHLYKVLYSIVRKEPPTQQDAAP